MDEPMSRFEQRLESALLHYVEGPGITWDPAEVVADATARPRAAGRRWPSWSNPIRLAAAAVVILAVGLTAVVGPRLLDRSSGASYPSMAVVNGVEYIVGLGRGLQIDDSDLSPYGRIERFNDPRFLGGDPTAFSLHGVDPLAALIVRSAPGLSDDSGPFPEYLVLARAPDSYAVLCAYYDPNDAASPTECRPATPEAPEPSRSLAPGPRRSLPVHSPSSSPPPTKTPAASATVYDARQVSDYLISLLKERTGVPGCAREAHVDFDTREVRRLAEALAADSERDVDRDLVLGSMADAIEVLGGTELVATQGPDIAWYLSDPVHVDPIGLDIDAPIIALELWRIPLDDGREVWWRSLSYVAVGPCP